MDVRLPDGTVVQNVPEGTSQGELLARVAKMRPSAADQIANDPITRGAQDIARASPAALIAGSAPGRFLLEPARGLLELGAHAPGIGSPEKVAALQPIRDLIQEGRRAYGTDKDFDLAGLAGQVASPAVLGAAKLIPAGAKLLPRIAGNAVVGATAGLTTPTEGKGDFAGEKALQMGSGLAVGGALPPAGALLRGLGGVVHKAFEPVLPGGPEAILNRFQAGILGPAKDKVIAALESARQLVPGSSPTVGEAISSIPGATGLAAHQQLVSKTRVAAPGFVARTQEQEAARAAALKGVAEPAGTDLGVAEMGRANEAKFNYGRAFDETVKADPTLARLAQDPYFKKALPDAIDLSASKEINAKDNLTQFLHYVKVGLDKQLSRTGDTALANTEKEAVQGVKNELTAWMDEKNPLYKVARERFASMSVLINQMKVGSGLLDKLSSSLGASERAAAYTAAVRHPESLIGETGSKKTLATILTPDQMAAVQGVGADLGRKAQFERLARGTNLAGSGPGPVESPLPNLLSRPAMVANYLARKVLGHNLEDKVNTVAGRQYLNPQELAAALKDQPPSQWKRITDALMQSRYGNAAVIGAPAVGLAQHF